MSRFPVCPDCGRPIPVLAYRCHRCGQAIPLAGMRTRQGAVPATPDARSAERESRVRLEAVAIGLALLSLAAAAVRWLAVTVA